MSLELNKTECSLGDALEGSVLLASKEDFEVQSVSIDLIGREKIRGNLLDFSGDDQTRIYSPVNSLARTQRPAEIDLLMHSNSIPLSGQFKVSSGYRGSFQFRLYIPPHLGPSYQGGRQDGSWLRRTWEVRAKVAVAGRPDLEYSKEISVVLPKPKEGAAGSSMMAAGGAQPSAASAQNPQQATGEQIPTNCPKCGAPLTVTQEDIFVTCRYCGHSITIASRQRLEKHSMLETRLFRQQAVEAALRYMDKGIFRVGVSKEAIVTNVVLRYLPFWVFKASATTSFRGTVGGGLAAPAGSPETQAAEVIGRLILAGADAYMRGGGGYRGRVDYRPPPPRTVAQTFSNTYVWPVLARSSMITEVSFYEIPVEKKIPFDLGRLPQDAEFLKPEMEEEEAKLKAKVEIEAKERKIASGKVSVLETITTTIYMGEGELVHAPVWFVYYTLKGENYVIAIDGCDGRALGGGRPAFKISL